MISLGTQQRSQMHILLVKRKETGALEDLGVDGKILK
jgi:hypothetical protein